MMPRNLLLPAVLLLLAACAPRTSVTMGQCEVWRGALGFTDVEGNVNMIFASQYGELCPGDKGFTESPREFCDALREKLPMANPMRQGLLDLVCSEETCAVLAEIYCSQEGIPQGPWIKQYTADQGCPVAGDALDAHCAP